MNSQNQDLFNDHQNKNGFNDQRGDSKMADRDQFQSFNAFFNDNTKGSFPMNHQNKEPFDSQVPNIMLSGEPGYHDQPQGSSSHQRTGDSNMIN